VRPWIPPYLKNLGAKRCVTMQLPGTTTDWARSTSPDADAANALLTVRHQLDSCLSCVSSNSSSSQQCKAGDVPHITRCKGVLDPTRLAWSYQTSPPPSSGEPTAVPSCIMGFNLRGADIDGTPKGGFLGLTKRQCQDWCDENSECKAYVFLAKGCEKHDVDSCYLKTQQAGEVMRIAPVATCMCACFDMNALFLPPNRRQRRVPASARSHSPPPSSSVRRHRCLLRAMVARCCHQAPAAPRSRRSRYSLYIALHAASTTAVAFLAVPPNVARSTLSPNVA
jgi:hypothetical protein